MLNEAGPRPVVVDFGAPWCDHCRTMVPVFVRLSEQFPLALFVLADVDKLPDSTRDVRYTPTFAFYSRGRKVMLRSAQGHTLLVFRPPGGCPLQVAERLLLLSSQVDEITGNNVQQLRDRLWLHAVPAPAPDPPPAH